MADQFRLRTSSPTPEDLFLSTSRISYLKSITYLPKGWSFENLVIPVIFTRFLVLLLSARFPSPFGHGLPNIRALLLEGQYVS